MTELLAKAIKAVEVLAPSDQDMIAQAILDLAHSAASDEIDPDHLEDVRLGLAEAANGDFATDEEVEDAFKSFRG